MSEHESLPTRKPITKAEVDAHIARRERFKPRDPAPIGAREWYVVVALADEQPRSKAEEANLVFFDADMVAWTTKLERGTRYLYRQEAKEIATLTDGYVQHVTLELRLGEKV